MRIAHAMEDDPARLWHPGQLADHFFKADLPEKAVPYMIAAAEDSLRQYALEDVVAILSTARTHIDAQPDLLDDTALRRYANTWLRALQQMGNFASIREIYSSIRTRLEAQSYTPERTIARTITAIASAHSRDYKGAENLALGALEEAQAHQDDWGAAWAKVALMRIYEETAWKPPAHIDALAEQILPVARKAGDRVLEMNALYLLCSNHRACGKRLKAQEVADALMHLSEAHNDRRALAFALWAKAIVHAVDINPEAALELAETAVANAIPGSGDETVGQGLVLFSQAFLCPPGDVRPRLDAWEAKGRRYSDYNIVASAVIIRVILEVRAGRLAHAWQVAQTYLNDTARPKNVNFPRQLHVIRAEVILTILGLIDPEAEAPPGRPKHPRAPPGLADLWLFLRLRLFGKKQAYACFEAALALDKLQEGAVFARCRIGQGLLDLSCGKRDAARQKLEEGLAEARAEGLSLLVTRSERALDAC